MMNYTITINGGRIYGAAIPSPDITTFKVTVNNSPGSKGNGIKSTLDNGDGTITYTYDDNTTFTTGSLIGPPGPKGDTGADGIDGAQGPAGADGIDGADGTSVTAQSLTQAAYDAIGTPDPNKFYAIID